MSEEDSLGARLRHVRGELKQSEFATLLGVDTKTISRYERGETKPDSDFFLKLKKKLDVNLDWLVTGEGQKSPVNIPYIPDLVEGCVVGTALVAERESWPLKRFAEEVNAMYKALLPEILNGRKIVPLDEGTIEALRIKAFSEREGSKKVGS